MVYEINCRPSSRLPDRSFSYDFVIRETIQRHVESLKRNYGGFNEGLPSYEETNFGIDNRADQIMLPSDHQASLLIFYHTVLVLIVVAYGVHAELLVMFRLVLNELKIKLDGVNESEESINGDFDQPRFGIPIFGHFRRV